jgi:methylated-DNA-protein-cysteine methyltransferase-like protein
LTKFVPKCGLKVVESEFYQNVYDLVRQIPPGRVCSYGLIARYLGSGKSSRLVGWAMNASHSQWPPVPAHRVVNRLGMLSGKAHFQTPFLMQELLEKEGVQIANDQVQDFEKRLWDPFLELHV